MCVCVCVSTVLPESDPFISGGRPRYQIGDHVRVNCTSARSKPAVQLAWYINSELADPAYVQHYPTIVSLAPDHLETSILGLEFRIKPKHFRRGDLKLKVRVLLGQSKRYLTVQTQPCSLIALASRSVPRYHINRLLEKQWGKHGKRQTPKGSHSWVAQIRPLYC